ncbi:MAG: ROK family protein [Sphingobacteriales bacterium]
MLSKRSLLKNTVIKEISLNQSLSCVTLSKKINKSFPATKQLLGELILEGVVVEDDNTESTGGRKPQMYTLKTGLMYVVSVAMDQHCTNIALIDIQTKEQVLKDKFILELPGNEDFLTPLTTHIRSFIEQSGTGKEKILGIGIGMPGFVNKKTGINHTYQNAESPSITRYISDRIGIPAYIDNDSRMVALAEMHFGASKNEANALVINIGWGTGLGLILDGKIFSGTSGLAGEFSHIPLFQNNKLCSCGKTGCLETEVSLSFIIQEAIARLKSGKVSALSLDNFNSDPHSQVESLVEAVNKGDKLIIELFSEMGYNLGRGIAILIHILNPGKIILSGLGSVVKKVWLPVINSALNEHCIPHLAEQTEIEVSAIDARAEIIGSAILVLENFSSEINQKDNKKTKTASYA